MKELPIIFKSNMVNAILDGQKTQTRRIIRCAYVNEKWGKIGLGNGRQAWGPLTKDRSYAIKCPYGQVGDRLWVREAITRSRFEDIIDNGTPDGILMAEEYVCYCADNSRSPFQINWYWESESLNSIHMPRWASRIMLEVTEVRIKRLHDLSEEEAYSEGVDPDLYYSHMLPNGEPFYETNYRSAYVDFWDKANTKKEYKWDKDPWVWVIDFKPLEIITGKRYD